jgi:hypothetical protein
VLSLPLELAMTHPLLDDPFVAAEIDAALSAYAKQLDAEQLAWAREQLAELLASQPAARELLDAAHPRQVDESGERLRPGVVAPGAAGVPGKAGSEPGRA